MRYDRRLFDRLVQRLTTSWDEESYVVLNRFTDCEGRRPSLYSTVRLPVSVLSFLRSKRNPILPKPVPFLTYEAIRELRRIVKPGMRVLEIGGGNSTLWFLDQGCEVVTIEHSAEWAEAMRGFVSDDTGWRLVVAEGDDALRVIDEEPDGSFDLLLVDSMNAHTRRVDALEVGRSKVRAGGWIVLDNSDFPINWSAVDLLGAPVRQFSGYAPMSLGVCQTSFWRQEQYAQG